MNDGLQGAYAGRRVAVLGATGYLGAAIAAALAAGDARVLLVSRRPPAPGAGREIFAGDIRTPECWNEVVRRADVVFHAAGNTSVSAAARDAAASLAVTVVPLTLLAAAARRAGRRPRVVFASTARIYDAPATPFARHNALAEDRLLRAADEGALDAVALRLDNAYGPSPCCPSDEGIVVNNMVRRAVRGCDLPLYGDGSVVRGHVYIDDVVRAFLQAGASPERGGRAVDVAGVAMTMREVFDLIVEHVSRATGTVAQVRSMPGPDEASPTIETPDDAGVPRAASDWAWRPAVAFPDGLDRLITQVLETRRG